MIDPHSLADYASDLLNTPGHPELEQRLGLYRVFLKLYEHHRELLNQILDLENTGSRSQLQHAVQYIQGVVQGQQVYLTTNLLQDGGTALVQPQQVWVIGRDRTVALSIQDKRLSRHHAAIQHIENQGFYLIDLNSTNGSFINGEPVRDCALLRDGDKIRLGSITFYFFVCRSSQMLDAVPPEVLTQINAARQKATAENNAPTRPDLDTVRIPWSAPTAAGSEETGLFLLSNQGGERR